VKRIAIVGIGSPQGDDRAGWITIEALDAEVSAHERAAACVNTSALDRPGIALLDHLRDVELAIVVDALRGDAPGTIVMLQPDELQRDATRTSTHGVGVAEALALGVTLQLLPPQLMVIGITIEPWSGNTDVSASVRRAADALARCLASWLRAGAEAWPPRLP
jgi:hydrogenase maturation protease